MGLKIFRHYENLPADVRGGAVAIGNFDGVHGGHQAVIDEAGKLARSDGLPWGVLTFEPHPRTILRPSRDPFRLTSFRSKARRIEALGVDFLVALHFDKAFSQQSADWFVRRVIVDGMATKHLVSGYDFVFGHGAQGTTERLLHMGAELGFGFTCLQAVRGENGEILSSTNVREALRAGDVRRAARILRRPFEVEGRVAHGDARGRQIGFPTANLLLGDYIQPALGVYAVWASVEDGPWLPGVANLGQRPTFDGTHVLLEVHLLDQQLDLYGKHLRVALVDLLRPEKKFDGIDSLRAQIETDCQAARRILEENPMPEAAGAQTAD